MFQPWVREGKEWLTGAARGLRGRGRGGPPDKVSVCEAEAEAEEQGFGLVPSQETAGRPALERLLETRSSLHGTRGMAHGDEGMAQGDEGSGTSRW